MGVVRKKNGSPLVVASKLSGTLVDDIIKANDPNLDFFQIEVDTTITSGTSSASDQFACFNSNGTCDMGWGDGSFNTSVNSTLTHTYASSGTYKVRCIGNQIFRGGSIPASGQRDSLKITQINRFGFYNGTVFGSFSWQGASIDGPLTVVDNPNPNLTHSYVSFFRNCGLTSMPSTLNMYVPFDIETEKMFFGNPNLGDIPNLTFTSYEAFEMFDSCTNFLGNGVENLTFNFDGGFDLQETFRDCLLFNGDVTGWNTTGATSMNNTFWNCESFNQNLGGWDLSIVTNMQGLCRESIAFNNGGVGGVGVGMDAWNIGKIQNMGYSFYQNRVLNQYIGSWDTSSVADMSSTFRDCFAFNNGDAAGVSGGGVGVGMDNWDMSFNSGFSGTFEDCHAFNQYIGSWNFSGNNLSGTNTATAANKLIDTSGVNFSTYGVSTVYDVKNLTTGEIANVTAVSATELTLDADIFTSVGDSYDVYKPVSLGNFLADADTFNQDCSNWDMTRVSAMSSTFRARSQNNLTRGQFNNGGNTGASGIDQWRFGRPLSMTQCFAFQENFNCEINSWNTEWVTSFQQFLQGGTGKLGSFNQPVNNLRFDRCGGIGSMFKGQANFNQPLTGGTGWGATMTSVTSASQAFGGCSGWNQPAEMDLSGLTGSMFGFIFGCSILNGGHPSGIRNRDFKIKLKSYPSGGGSIDWSSWAYQTQAWAVDMETAGGYWDMSGVSGMGQALFNTSLNQDLSSWSLKSITQGTSMFGNVGGIMSLFNICKTLPGWVSNVPNTGANTPGLFGNKTISKTTTESTVTTGTATSVTALKLVDTGVDFVTLGVAVGDRVNNTTTGEYAEIKAVAATELDLDFDAFLATDNYEIITGYDAAAGYEAYNKLAAPTPASYTLSGTNTSTNTSELIDSGTDFVTSGVLTGMVVKNTTAGTSSVVSSVATNTLTLADDIFTSTSQNYTIEGGYGWILTGGLNWT